MRYFPEKTFFTVGLFHLASPMNIHPLNLWINITKIDFASPSHLEERSQVLETSGKKLCDFHYHVLSQEKNVTWSRY